MRRTTRAKGGSELRRGAREKRGRIVIKRRRRCEVDGFHVSPISTVDRVVDPVTGAVRITKACYFAAFFRRNGFCDCCAFRQYVYASTLTVNGVPIRAIGRVLLDGIGVYEDVDASGSAYGHREAAGEDGDRYVPDQADGCIYVGRDFPGIRRPPGVTYDINFHFLDVIIDTCNGNKIVAGPLFWDMVASGTT